MNCGNSRVARTFFRQTEIQALTLHRKSVRVAQRQEVSVRHSSCCFADCGTSPGNIEDVGTAFGGRVRGPPSEATRGEP